MRVTYRCLALTVIGPDVGPVFLTPEQLSRLAYRRCVDKAKGGGYKILEDVHFKRGEQITVSEPLPKKYNALVTLVEGAEAA